MKLLAFFLSELSQPPVDRSRFQLRRRGSLQNSRQCSPHATRARQSCELFPALLPALK